MDAGVGGREGGAGQRRSSSAVEALLRVVLMRFGASPALRGLRGLPVAGGRVSHAIKGGRGKGGGVPLGPLRVSCHPASRKGGSNGGSGSVYSRGRRRAQPLGCRVPPPPLVAHFSAAAESGGGCGRRAVRRLLACWISCRRAGAFVCDVAAVAAVSLFCAVRVGAGFFPRRMGHWGVSVTGADHSSFLTSVTRWLVVRLGGVFRPFASVSCCHGC